jgi:hypothetical protein
VRVDKNYSKSGRVAAIYAKKRIMFCKFENYPDFITFLNMMKHIIHEEDNLPLYIEGKQFKAVSQF